MHTYNTNQIPLKLKEYGRNVQTLVTQLEKIQDKNLRTKYAEAILKVMGVLDTDNTKPSNEYIQKRWNDLFMMTDYKLDVDSPYLISAKELVVKKPERLSYPKHSIKYRHCGHHIEMLIKKALEVTDPSKQAAMIITIAKLIKSFSATWNKDNLDINTIMSIIQDLAGDKLIVDLEKLKSDHSFKNFNNTTTKEKKKTSHRKKKASFASKAK